MNHFQLEWFSRDNFFSPLLTLVTYGHVQNWFTHLLNRGQTTSQQIFFMNHKFQLIVFIYFEIPCINVQVMTWTRGFFLLIYKLFYHLTFNCALDLQLTWKNVSKGTFTPQEEELCQIILKSMHKYWSYGPTSSVYDHFIIWPSSVTFNLSEQMFQMAF